MSNGSDTNSPFIARLLAKRALIAGENADAYDQLVDLVRKEAAPQTFQETLLVKDIANAEWELLRLHGMKAGMVNAIMYRLLKEPKWETDGGPTKIDEDTSGSARQLLRKAAAGDSAAQTELRNMLEENNLSFDIVAAGAFDRNISSQLHTDRMIAACNSRRNAAYAELERLRAKRSHEQKNPTETPEANADIGMATNGHGGFPGNPRRPVTRPVQ
jgi:hypothetical protein